MTVIRTKGRLARVAAQRSDQEKYFIWQRQLAGFRGNPAGFAAARPQNECI